MAIVILPTERKCGGSIRFPCKIVVWINTSTSQWAPKKDGGFVCSEGNQASVLTRYLALMFVNGIEKALIFNLKDYDKGRSIKIKRINDIFETYISKL